MSFPAAGGLESGDAALLMRSVSGTSSHRLGLEAELSVLWRCGRATTSGLAKDHCESCEVTAMSTMVARWGRGKRESAGKACSAARYIDISDWAVVWLGLKPEACRSYAPMVEEEGVAWGHKASVRLSETRGVTVNSQRRRSRFECECESWCGVVVEGH